MGQTVIDNTYCRMTESNYILDHFPVNTSVMDKLEHSSEQQILRSPVLESKLQNLSDTNPMEITYVRAKPQNKDSSIRTQELDQAKENGHEDRSFMDQTISLSD